MPFHGPLRVSAFRVSIVAAEPVARGGLQREVDAKRDARWRLRMLSEDHQNFCIEKGVSADTYTAMGTFLDKFTGFLRGSVD